MKWTLTSLQVEFTGQVYKPPTSLRRLSSLITLEDTYKKFERKSPTIFKLIETRTDTNTMINTTENEGEHQTGSPFIIDATL